MAEETAPLVQVYITTNALLTGQIEVAWASISGDCICVREQEAYRHLAGEGSNWHRTKWAAENFARQKQAAFLDKLRSEITRVEGYRFGRPGS